jgi:glycosyltransferase involved in cell wall biosynthesis
MNRRRLKICLLTSSYPRSSEDTASVFLRHLADKLADRGVDVHVLAPADGEGATTIEKNVTVRRFQYLPVSLQKLAYGSGILPNLRRQPLLWTQVPFFLASMTWSLLRLIRRERPDLIHAHWILPQGLVAVLSKYLCGISVITTAHGTDAFALQNKLVRRLKRFVVGKSDAWTANSRATSNAIGWPASLPSPRIIPMGVDADFFSRGNPDSLRRELPENDSLVLFVGRLIENKGCRDLLHAVSLLPESIRAKTTLWIVGDGYDRASLQQSANAFRISHKVRFWGSVRNDLLPNFYAAADLFVAPSIQTASGEAEGQNVALLEASAARACVLATRIGGISEFVKDGITGVLVEPGNPRELAAAMEKLLLDAPLRSRLAESASLDVKSRYDWRQIAAQFEQLYRQVVKAE